MTSVLVKEILPLSDKSDDRILQTVKTILKRPGLVRFVVDARQDTLDYWRVASEEEAAELTVTFRAVLRSVQMEEYDILDGNEGKTSFEQIFDMFEMVVDSGCMPSHILSGRGSIILRKWIPISRKATSIYGVPLLFEKSLEPDVLIICGAKTHDATAADIKYAVKVTLP